MKLAIAQLSNTVDKKLNLKKAKEYIIKAKARGADFVVLPEFYMALATPKSGLLPVDVAEPLDGSFVTGLKETARSNQIYVVCGVYESKEGETERAYNTTVFINPSGNIVHTYRKTHLYDAFSAKESDTIIPGENPYKVIETEFGRIGIMVCYELRFPEIARQFALQDADILIVPAGWFAGPMKEEHWQTLLRARAIENTMYICGANLTGSEFTGRSMVVDPMGVIRASVGEEDDMLLTDLTSDRIDRVRGKLPSVNHRRPEFYVQK